jgi:hypothetical protein
MNAPKPRKYYTLAVAFKPGDDFTSQFGDYDRSVVVEESKDSYPWDSIHNKRIVESADDQASINIAVRRLNLD